ncbi:MAG: hypothetical protein K8R64_05675 [Methanosarcinaceae archaeon]|nr:hypothetical protein [Methanosarcinaceae archaeon]
MEPYNQLISIIPKEVIYAKGRANTPAPCKLNACHSSGCNKYGHHAIGEHGMPPPPEVTSGMILDQ